MFKVLPGSISTRMLLEWFVGQAVRTEGSTKSVIFTSSTDDSDCCITVLGNWEIDKEDKIMLFKTMPIRPSYVSSRKDNVFSMDNTSLIKPVSGSSSSIQTTCSCSNLGLAGGCKHSVLVEFPSNIKIFPNL